MAYLLLCLVVYFWRPGKAREARAGLWLGLCVFGLVFLLVEWHPQWLVLLGPFLVLTTLLEKNKLPWLFIDILLCAGFVLTCAAAVPIHPISGVQSVFISNAYAQAAGGASGDPMSSIMSFLPMIAMFAVLYFVMIRPQMKKQKEHRAMVEALAAGDEVVTAGGILGKVTRVRDGNVDVQVANGVEVQLQKSAVVQVLPKGTIK